MGFKSSADVIEQLLLLTPGRSACFFKPNNGAPLPNNLKLDVVITDMSSKLFSIYFGVRTGRELLRFVNAQMSEACRQFGASSFYFCVDDRSCVTTAKAAERLKRVEAKEVEPYKEMVELKGLTTPSVPLAGFQFGLGPLPVDYDRMLATDELRVKWFVFVGDLIASYTCTPDPSRLITITTSGFRRCSCGNRECELSRESKVVKTFFLPREMVKDTNEPVTGVLAMALHDAGTPLPDLSAAGSGCQFAPTAQCARKQHIDSFRQVEKPSIGVGEAEGQCFYWVHQTTLQEKTGRALVRVNDSDAVTCALMCVPRLYNPQSSRIDCSLWLDLTSTADNVRYFDAVAWWRSLSARLYELGGVANNLARSSSDTGVSSSATAASRKPVHGLIHPVETALFIATLTGTDYCNGLSRLGPSTIFKNFVSLFVKKVATSDPPFLQINSRTGDMIFSEEMAFEFILDSYATMGPVQEALKELRFTREAMSTDHTLDRLALFFENKLEESCKKARAANKPETGVIRAALVFPRAPQIRATIRRACFSIYYYYNAHKPLVIDANLKIGDHYLYGYTEDGRFSDSVMQHPFLRPFVLVGSGSAPPSATSSPANFLKRKSSAETEDDEATEEMTKSGGGDDVVASRPAKRVSTGAEGSTLQWDRRNNGIDLITLAIKRGLADKAVGNGPEEKWITSQVGRFAHNAYRPFPGEHGSFLPAVERLRREMKDSK